MRITKASCFFVLGWLAFHSALAQPFSALNGSFPVKESWSVAVYRGASDTPSTFSGTETGTLVVSNGTYLQLNHTGGKITSSLDTSETISYDGTSYGVSTAYPFSVEGAGLGVIYAGVQLTFFVVAIPLGSQSDLPSPYPGGSTVFTATGTSLTSLAGYGNMVDQNSAFGPVGPSYFVNQVTASSTASLTIPVVVPAIAAPPFSQVALAGSDASFSVQATGTAPFTYQWKHGGTTLSDSPKYNGTTGSTLSISGVAAADAGSYTVTVSNSKGSASASASLMVVPTQTLQILHGFTNGFDGASADSPLLLSGDTLFGTASGGGSSGNGTVFAVNNNGTGFRVLHEFSGGTPESTNSFGGIITTNGDGIAPSSGLVMASNVFYGTTSQGGPSGNGVVFAVGPDGTGYRVLHSFSGSGGSSFGTNGDGAGPIGGLAISSDTLYGAAGGGGLWGNGTVFRVKLDGSGFTTLYSFTGGNDGANPTGGFLIAGNELYGTAAAGGDAGNGTVFRMNLDGTGLTNLHSFGATSGSVVFPINNDGLYPSSGLVLLGNTLYGSATYGGAYGNGTLFSVKTSGTGFTTLHVFSGTDGNGLNGEGAYPQSGLALIGTTLYGTAQNGGTSGSGTVFAINTNGTGLTVLYNFNDDKDGAVPLSRLVSSGNSLYGTAYSGGPSNFGTVFSLWVQQPGAPQGSLKITLAPPTAINAGAQWRVDGGEFQGSGTVVSNLLVGQHTVSFAAVGGWIPPMNQIVSVAVNSTTMATANYAQETNYPFPIILSNARDLSTNSNQFSFTISGATNLPVIVEASTNLANPSWQPLQTNNSIGGVARFSDSQWQQYPMRFYRVRSTP